MELTFQNHISCEDAETDMMTAIKELPTKLGESADQQSPLVIRIQSRNGFFLRHWPEQSLPSFFWVNIPYLSPNWFAPRPVSSYKPSV